MHDGEFARFAAHLAEHVFINHRTVDPGLRVPHVTHWGVCEVSESVLPRIQKAVSIVSNNGGGANWIHEDLKLRNHFAIAAKVDLFGKTEVWESFSKPFWGKPRPPRNYRGEIRSDDGKWHGQQKRTLQASYKAAVCLENVCEENYFTEKFVEAVRVGCIPIYHADKVVAKTYLQGAAWVDPADFGFNVKKTIRAALVSDGEAYVRQNRLWLATNKYLALTQGEQVLERLATIMKSL